MTTSAHNFEATTSAFLLGHTPAQHNNKYKAYASAVDKALKSFESTTEWADLIAALGKLGKVFSSNAKSFNDIPNALTVSKRLAQCLHPALPSGVHLKALDTYRQVFLMLSRTQNLAKYLFLYSSGLFPLMDHCQIKVKSELLSIFEQFILPLGPNLCPALAGFITALLLALEEGTEFYGRAFNLLDQLLEKVGTDAFYLCFWQAVSGNPSARLPALIFVNTKIEKHRKVKNDVNNEENDLLFCGGQLLNNLMLQALCCVAEDSSSSPLVQRHLLDFLCMALPLNSKWTTRQQLVDLLGKTLFLVLRRDMSLNRRLYQWLLNRSNDMAFVSLPVNGLEDVTDLAFFKQYALPVIKSAIRDYLKADTIVEISPPSMGTLRRESFLKKTQIQFPEVRVCRLLHYMLDRPELGQLVLEEILPNLLETFCLRDPNLSKELCLECEAIDPLFENFYETFVLMRGNETFFNEVDNNTEQQSRRTEEILKNFNSLLKALEPNFLWNFFEKLFSLIKTQNQATQDQQVSNNKYSPPSFSIDSGSHYQHHKDQLCSLFPVVLFYEIF